MNKNSCPGAWEFWIDRGGTFTDIVARQPDGTLATAKLLSQAPGRYDDAAIEGIRRFLGLGSAAALPEGAVAAIKMGTTVATNALLERAGEPTLLVVTRGFADILRIGTQHRPELFARTIRLPEMLYTEVLEISERVDAAGQVLHPVDLPAAKAGLQAAYARGLRAVAVVFLHGWRYVEHECAVAELAKALGFTQISVSHQISPLMKMVPRGNTTVVDAYVSPILHRYVRQLAGLTGKTPLMFMQSNGGLTAAQSVFGKDSLLSGPAGGVVGAVKAAGLAGFSRIIGFDMGGTSTDVFHYDGSFERCLDSVIAGVPVQSPSMRIHTVAAGGGSILRFDGQRFRVGPQSAGADPGPLCYRRNGPLTVTDANVMLGKIRPAFFPHLFGPDGNLPLDQAAVVERFQQLALSIGDGRDAWQVAEGFLTIAVANMANAIKKVSVERGYDLENYVLVCFGGAGGQHACLVADALGMTRLLLHPLAGVLSAYGIGLAEQRVLGQQAVEARLDEALMPKLARWVEQLAQQGRAQLADQGVRADHSVARVHLRYQGTDSSLEVAMAEFADLQDQFIARHQQRYGFVQEDCPLVVASLTVETIGATTKLTPPPAPSPRTGPLIPLGQ
ncbi:MAG TPA: 5-oxoprolinase, partial [Rhodospirillaceae bacterium]|nr:5-oxoprolinase [Rhodospirillaceae bacterium]